MVSKANSLAPPCFGPLSAPTAAVIAEYMSEPVPATRSEEHTSELQSHSDLVCRLLLEKKKNRNRTKETNPLMRGQLISMHDIRRIILRIRAIDDYAFVKMRVGRERWCGIGQLTKTAH